MARHVLVTLVGVMLSVGAAGAQTAIEKVPIKPTDIDGATMFASYCAACHGKGGRGDGPAVKALAKAPPDLTTLSARNKGTFPDVRVRRFIEGLDETPAHGSRDMPMWGELFRSLNADTAKLRVEGLAQYIRGLQR